MAGVLPAGGTKQAGRGRGVGREKEAYSPPGQLVVGCSWRHGRGVVDSQQGYSPPEERSKLVARKSLLVADGEWDARSKHILRPVKPVVGKNGGE